MPLINLCIPKTVQLTVFIHSLWLTLSILPKNMASINVVTTIFSYIRIYTQFIFINAKNIYLHLFIYMYLITLNYFKYYSYSVLQKFVVSKHFLFVLFILYMLHITILYIMYILKFQIYLSWSSGKSRFNVDAMIEKCFYW